MWSTWEFANRNHTKKLGKTMKKTTERHCFQKIGIVRRTKEFRKASVRTGTNNILRRGAVSGRVSGSKALGVVPSQKRSTTGAVGNCSRKDAFSLETAPLENEAGEVYGHRSQAEVTVRPFPWLQLVILCLSSHVFLKTAFLFFSRCTRISVEREAAEKPAAVT